MTMQVQVQLYQRRNRRYIGSNTAAVPCAPYWLATRTYTYQRKPAVVDWLAQWLK